ncbi:hypothetical protein MAR_023812 [Mya arenaria]|uniref:Uncharacterized protein n=1 Tax=Mya arenaria TaxID=6604 RepID=A0ABY7DS71_MYAAR|nr:hypothetical protein MAR_023812 [Mya arenaria]
MMCDVQFCFISDVGTPGPVGSQKTVFATTIPVGSVLETPGNMSMDMPLMTQSMYVPRSQPSQAVNMQRSRATEDIERSRPRSMSPQSPFSTSPVSMSMLQEVKLRPRQAPEKTPAETVPQASGSENELAKAFNRAKRISKKFDESGALNMESQKSKVQETETVSSLKDLNQSSVKPVNVKLRSAEMTKSDEKASLPTTAVDKNIPVTEPSFAVKKDPLKPAFKSTTLPVNMKPSDMEAFGDSQKSGSEGYGKKSDEQKVSFATDKTAGNVSEVSKATSEAAANKLASPREDYRMKRQARSKTLPVSKDLMDNNVETITSGNRRSANFENSVTNSSGANENKPDTDYENIGNVKKDEPEYDNIASVRKEKESSVRRRQGDYENFALNKRSSWAPSTSVAAPSTGQPEWISRVQKLEKPADDKSDPARPKEIKIGPIKSENKKDSPKSPETEKITFEKASAVSKPASQPSAAKLGGVSSISKQSSIEKPGVSGSKPAFNTPVNSSQPNKPAVSSIGKPPIGSASKPISTTTPKSTPTDTKPTVSTSSVRKSSVGSAKPFQVEKPAFSSVKPPVALASKPSSDKPTASSSSSSTATSKLSSPTKSVGRPDSGGSKSSTPLNVSPHRASLKSNLAKTENKNTVLQPINNENKNINNKSSMNSSVGKVGSSFGSGKTGCEPEKATAGITKRNFKPVGFWKSTNAPLREKAKVTPEKCSNISASRPSKVLDMVKNFQSMQYSEQRQFFSYLTLRNVMVYVNGNHDKEVFHVVHQLKCNYTLQNVVIMALEYLVYTELGGVCLYTSHSVPVLDLRVRAIWDMLHPTVKICSKDQIWFATIVGQSNARRLLRNSQDKYVGMDR